MRPELSTAPSKGQRPDTVLALYGILTGLGGLLTLGWVFGTKSASENAFWLGLSLPRILLGTGIILLTLLCLGVAARSIKRPAWAGMIWERVIRPRSISGRVLWIAAAGFTAGWIGSFLPPYRAPEGFGDYLTRLRPISAWLIMISLLTVLLIMLARRWETRRPSSLAAGRPAIRFGLLLLSAFSLVWLLISFTGLGLRFREDYWYPAGVPVLGLQLLFAVLAGLFAYWLESRLKNEHTNRLDILLCFGLWGITALIWAQQPLRHTYFMTGPYAPNDEIYPYSDAALFDSGSQFALIGQGLFNGQYFDRALYPALLTYLHAAFGQNTELLMGVQAILYAVFPVIAYLLGRLLYSRAVGVAAAALVTLRGLNAIQAVTWIDLSNPKMMLTDFPTAIGIALMLLFVLLWSRDRARWHYLVWAGASLGMTLMLRIHVLLLLPFLLLWLFIVIGPRRRLWLAGAFLILGMLTATLPWDIRNQTRGFPMFYMYYSRVLFVLEQRYQWPPESSLPGGIEASADADQTRAQIARNTHGRMASGPTVIARCQTRICSIANHFLHNLVASVLVLPTSLNLDDLRHTVKESTPYWRQDWRGEGFDLADGGVLAANLAMIALGGGLAWQRLRFAGVLPGILFLAYILSNALAQTSGGRYVTPIDWIVCLYFLAGVLQLAIWCLQILSPPAHPALHRQTVEPESASLPRPSRWSLLPAFALVFGIGALVPLAEALFPPRYSPRTPQEMVSVLDQEGWLKKADLDQEALLTFLSNPEAEIIWGRALYPRYYKINDGEPGGDYPYIVLDFPRLVFITIGPSGEKAVILPGPMPDFIPQAADAIALGCRTEKYMDALAVFVLTEPGAVYRRYPDSALQCPLQGIFCENNELCWSK